MYLGLCNTITVPDLEFTASKSTCGEVVQLTAYKTEATEVHFHVYEQRDSLQVFTTGFTDRSATFRSVSIALAISKPIDGLVQRLEDDLYGEGLENRREERSIVRIHHHLRLHRLPTLFHSCFGPVVNSFQCVVFWNSIAARRSWVASAGWQLVL